MFVPVRCFSCGKVLAPIYDKYKELIRSGKTPSEAFEELGITRYCCRRTILTHVDLYQEILPFGENVDRMSVLRELMRKYYG